MSKHTTLLPCNGKSILGWQFVGNLGLDWMPISTILGTIIFIVTNVAIFTWLARYRPEVLCTRSRGHAETTFDWKVIREIVLQCSWSGPH
jgi:hypothetical protein